MAELGFVKALTPVLDAPDPTELARFYAEFLGWEISEHSDPTWAMLVPPGKKRSFLSIQLEPLYVAPTWPSTAEHQQMQIHLDLWVSDLEDAVARAESCGARVADTQFDEGVRVMVDPEGHLFCLFED